MKRHQIIFAGGNDFVRRQREAIAIARTIQETAPMVPWEVTVMLTRAVIQALGDESDSGMGVEHLESLGAHDGAIERVEMLEGDSSIALEVTQKGVHHE